MKKLFIVAIMLFGLVNIINAEPTAKKDSSKYTKEQISKIMQDTRAALDTLNTYSILNEDSTIVPIKTEYGVLSKHLNGFQRGMKKVGDVLEKAGNIGGIGAIIMETVGILGKNVDTLLGSLQLLYTADNLSDIAGKINTLSSFEGKDFIFKRPVSKNTVTIGKEGIKILINSPLNNDPSFDPMLCYRVVHLESDKNERWFQVQDFEPTQIWNGKASKEGYINFETAKMEGSKSVISIPASSLESGEQYAIVYMNLMATSIPVATFEAE